MASQMTVTVETGEQLVANVYDIVDSFWFRKTFIFYSFENDPDSLYASILHETKDTVTFEPITNPKEIRFVEKEIRRIVKELL